MSNIHELIDNHLEYNRERPRPHLGCSVLGHSCDRWLWLSFRWAVIDRPAGRLLRLFKRGHDEEQNAIKYLRMVGYKVADTQKTVDFRSHVSGSIDGTVIGLKDDELRKYLLEVKTHNQKSFNELEKKGVKDAKPLHYIQMQVYMHGLGLDRALYYAVCKNDDRLWTERVMYDRDTAVQAVERGQRIAMSQRMVEPLSGNPDYYICKMCPANTFCHKTQVTTEVNCRTCVHSVPNENSTWTCSVYDAVIPYEAQLQGCPKHVLHPDLVPYPCAGIENGRATFIVNGSYIKNGEKASDCFTSQELLADPQTCSEQDDLIKALRMDLGARIVEPTILDAQ